MTTKIAIIGYGWVGKAQKELFPDALVYVRDVSKYSELDEERLNLTDRKDKVNKCDVAFISVPTPCPAEGRLDTSIVEEIISWCECPLIVVRSTVNPGDCWRWHLMFKKDIVFQPEYLGETPQHPLLDTKQTPFIIIGGQTKPRRKLIELYTQVYNANVRIRQMDEYTAEVVKLSENRAIAYRVAECQELYDACEAANVDYYSVREAVYGDDPRMQLWWSFIYTEKRGFNSKCIPKDIYAWCAWAESNKVDVPITKKILTKNKKWIKPYVKPTSNA